MAKKPESKLQLKIKKALIKECGGKWVKLHGGPFQEAGLPDLLGCVDGWFFGFEVKVPGRGKASALQLQTLKEYRKVGGICCIVENPEEAVAVVKAITSSPEIRRSGGKLRKWLRAFVCSTEW